MGWKETLLGLDPTDQVDRTNQAGQTDSIPEPNSAADSASALQSAKSSSSSSASGSASDSQSAAASTPTISQKLPKSGLNKAEGQLSVDVYETNEAIIIIAPIAGVKRADIKITVTDDVLEIKGFRRFQEEAKKEQFYSQECFWGAFSRAIVLPARVKPNQVRASLKEGILKVSVPKAHLTQAQEVPIIEDEEDKN